MRFGKATKLYSCEITRNSNLPDVHILCSQLIQKR